MATVDELDVDLCLGMWDIAQGSIFFKWYRQSILSYIWFVFVFHRAWRLFLDPSCSLVSRFLATSVLLMSIWPEITGVITA